MRAAWLEQPSERGRAALPAFLDDLATDGTERSGSHALAREDFAAYLEHVRAAASGVGLPPGKVAMSTYWLVTDDAIVGEARLRHELTPRLEIEGGHIGYMIAPSARRQGYGARILALVLAEARALGLTRALVTCDADNVGSRRIIERNGGALVERRASPERGVEIHRYWIELD